MCCWKLFCSGYYKSWHPTKTLCSLLLNCWKQQPIISFSLSSHHRWFLRNNCIPRIPVICLRSWGFPVSFVFLYLGVILTFLIKLSFCFLSFLSVPFFWCRIRRVASGVKVVVHYRFMQWHCRVFCLVLSVFLNNCLVSFNHQSDVFRELAALTS